MSNLLYFLQFQMNVMKLHFFSLYSKAFLLSKNFFIPFNISKRGPSLEHPASKAFLLLARFWRSFLLGKEKDERRLCSHGVPRTKTFHIKISSR